MRNFRDRWTPGMWRDEEIGIGRERGLQSFWQSAIQSRRLERTARRKMRVRLMIKAMNSFKERRDRAFAALRSRLEKSLGEEQETLFGDELIDTSEPYNTSEGSTRELKVAQVAMATNNALFSVFDQLSSADYNRDGSVKVSVVNDELEDKGYGRVDKEMIDDAFKEWSLDQGQGPAPAPATKQATAKKRTRKRKATKKATKTTTKGE